MRTIAVCILLLLIPSSVFADQLPVFLGNEIVVTASKRLESKLESFANVSVITREDIKNLGAKTAADAVRFASGVYIKSNGGIGGINTVRLKSSSTEQVLVLIDGNRINSSLLGMADLGDVPVDNIERIEIIGEASSALYGADALGGIINIITRRKDDEKINASLKYASYGELTGGLSKCGTIHSINYYVAYNNLKSNGFRANSDFKSQNYTINLDIKNLLSVKLNTISSSRGNPGVPTSDSDPSSSSLPGDRQSDLYNNASISLGKKVNDLIDYSFSLSQNTSDQRVHYEDWFTRGTFTDDRYLSKISEAEFRNVLKLGKYFITTAGLGWRRNSGESSMSGNKSTDNTSLYVNSEIGNKSALAANIGARVDKHTTWGSIITPRVGFMLSINKHTLLRASVAKGFRAPTINELYWNDPVFSTFGNAALKPETSTNATLGLEKALGLCDASVEYYVNKISDMIKWEETAPGSWSYHTVNVDKAKIEGLSLEIKKPISESISGFINYTIEKAANETTGKVIAYSPERKMNAGIFLKDKKGLLIKIAGRSVSQVYSDAANTKTIQSYGVIDLGISKTIGNFQATINGYNIFNEKYFESVGVSPSDFKERGYPMPGRRIEIGFSFGS